MQQLNQRQQKIVDFLLKNKIAGNAQIVAFLGRQVSRFTVLRDLDFLLIAKLIKREGKGRSVHYSLNLRGAINAYFDPILYFKKGPDERIIKTDFNPEIIDELPQLFSDQEIADLKKINDKYTQSIKNADDSFIRRETERLTIELSWKSSRLEGNTYSLIDTEILIKERVEANGHKKEEATMILNHKNAIDYIFANKNEFKKLDIYHIEKVHELLTRGLHIHAGIRNAPVRIIGTRYVPPSSKAKIIKIIDLATAKINTLDNYFSRSLATALLVSYIQPFEDGNKRTARILANAMFLANGICPISYRSVDESDYKKTMILFYEQNSARFFKELFVEQFKFAVANYF